MLEQGTDSPGLMLVSVHEGSISGVCQSFYPCGHLDAVASCLWRRLQGEFLEDYEPTLGGEDFSFYGHAGVPAAFSFLGIRNETAGSVHGLHTPRFMLDEEVLQTGAAYLASLASEFLTQYQKPLGKEEL